MYTLRRHAAQALGLLLSLVILTGGERCARAETAHFVGRGDAQIAYRIDRPPAAIGAVVMLSGYTESYLYYDELIADMLAQNYAVYIMDHRGMGGSTRLAANRQIVHVTDFEDYVDDVETFVDKVVRKDLETRPLPLYLFAHSTGGLVGARLLARRPTLFKAAALSAPLMEINTGKVPALVAYAAVYAATALGFGDRYAPGSSDARSDLRSYETNVVTHSRVRYDAHEQVRIAHPELVQGGPSSAWVKAVMDTTRALPEWAPRVVTPLVVFQAGDDVFVRPDGQALFCAAAARCRLRRFDKAYHELIRETDDVRKVLLVETFQLFAAP